MIDGDTLELDLRVFPDLTRRVTLRLAGVDTPETRGASDCEEALGNRATALAKDLLDGAQAIRVRIEGQGKFGRWLGRVAIDGRDLARALIEAGLGRPYDGGRREAWC